MERNIQKYWQEEVAKIIKVRKARELNQERLAAIAGISTQTLSRFEQAREDVQLSTVLKILDVFSLQLTVDNSHYFKVFIYKLLIDAIRSDSKALGGFLHNGDPGHPCYAMGAKGLSSGFEQDDNEDQNEIYQFLKSIAEEIAVYQDAPVDYPLILSWQDFCELLYNSYVNNPFKTPNK